MFTEWQVYRMLDWGRGAWSTFQFVVRERLAAEGVHVDPTDAPARSSGGNVRADSALSDASSGEVPCR